MSWPRRDGQIAAGLVIVWIGLSGVALAEGPAPRQGGDTCALALPIPGVIDPNLPYFDCGTTCLYENQYLGACSVPAGGPDVVYVYTPPINQLVEISVCGGIECGDTDFDTLLYVYADTCDGSGFLVCDDSGCDDGAASRLDLVDLDAGRSYYIVIDGPDETCGNYELRLAHLAERPDCADLEDVLYSQTVEVMSGAGLTSDVAAGVAVQDNFSGRPAPVTGLRWWGTTAVNFGGWASCEKPDARFAVSFYADDGGQPGALVCGPTVVTPTVSEPILPEYIAPELALLEFTATDFTACALAAGWVEIKGLDDGQGCWFLWGAAREGDGASYRKDLDTGVLTLEPSDLSYCLLGGYTPAFGACCDLLEGTCEDDVEAVDCAGPYRAFTADTSCAALDPPCEPALGACCYDEGSCELLPQADCGVPPCCPGDCNCDGAVDLRDINPFAAGLASGVYCNECNFDLNGDGVASIRDINPFAVLLASGPHPIPCPRQRETTAIWLGPETTCTQCPCAIGCPPDGAPESEPCGEDLNGGCDAGDDGDLFELLACGDVLCGTLWADETDADTDWYRLELNATTALTVTVEAESPVFVGIADQAVPGLAGCANWTGAFFPAGAAAECDLAGLTYCAPPGTHYLVVTVRADVDAVACPADYVLTLECAGCTLPTGRCCYDNPTQCAEDLIEAECLAWGGVWEQGADCTSPCPEPLADTCDVARMITELPFAVAFDNATAHADGPMGLCDKYLAEPNAPMQNDAWFVWAAAADCYVTATVAASYDAIVVVRSDCEALNETVCADEGDLGETEVLAFSATANSTYYFQIGDTGYSPGGGATILSLTCDANVEGACCDRFGGCTEASLSACVEADGVYQGAGTTCAAVTCPDLSAGDFCLNPKLLVIDPGVLPVVDADTTCGRGDTYDDPTDASCLEIYDSGEDMIYRLNVVENVAVQIRLDPLSTVNTGMALGTDCPPTEACLAASYRAFALPHALPCVYLEAGESYYLQIDSGVGTDCIPAFELSIEVCTLPTGACCVDTDCIGTMILPECEVHGGTWFEGEDCDSYICPGAWPGDTLTIEIFTDYKPFETSWEVAELDGTVMAAGGPTAAHTLHTWDVYLETGACYTFTIADYAGDGILPPGYFNLYLNEVLVYAQDDFDSASETVLVGSGCGGELGACCVAGECVATETLAECQARPGTWYAGESCAAGFSCEVEPCADAVFHNGTYLADPDPDATSLSAGRDRDGTSMQPNDWIVEDVTFDTPVTVQSLHWWGNEPVTFNWGGFTDYVILADDGGVPGALVVGAVDAWATRVDTGDTLFGDPVWFYSIPNLSIALDPGTYWFGMRVVQELPYGSGPFDQGWWVVTTPNGTSPMWLNYGDSGWLPGSMYYGMQYHMAFCVVGTEP